MEEWRPVVGYENQYEVSSLGRVRRVDGLVKTGIKYNEFRHIKGKVLKQHRKRNGYFTVDLSSGNTVKTISVHKLVATAFLTKRDGQTQVNHINCNKADNRAENLEWCSAKENREHAKANGLYHNPNGKPVRCKQTNKVFESSFKAAEWLNETKFQNTRQVKAVANKIRAACHGLQKSAYGYTWEHYDMKGSSTIPYGSRGKSSEMGCTE